MLMTMPQSLRNKALRFIGCRAQRFAKDTEGVSLVEFAFMFPILVIILMMTITLSHMMMIDRKVSIAAQSAADLIAQRQEVDDDAMTEIKVAAGLMMQPFASDFSISVAHVPFALPGGEPDMDADEAWRALIGESVEIPDDIAEAAANGAGISAPAGAVTGALGTPGDALIMLIMVYQYQSLWVSDFSLMGLNFPGTMIFTKVTFARPRLIRQIASTADVITIP